jgi:hypothetical protein
MIRFIPDTWLEWLLRFFAMAAPNGNVYVEIPAPDLRFAAIVLAALAVALCWRRITSNPRPALVLLGIVVLSTLPWLATSGNGRYWMPMLLLGGPLLAGLIFLLPVTRAFRLFMVGGLIAAQAFVLGETSPWGAWTWAVWKRAPYFHVDVPAAEAAAKGTTYVTLSTISYSVIAPQFPASARWMNITSIGGTGRDVLWGHEFLRAAPGEIKLVAPSIKGQFADDGGPTPAIRKALDALLSAQSLALVPGSRCELARSRGLTLAAHVGTEEAAEPEDVGYWICPLRYPVAPPPERSRPPDPETEAAFARIEQGCPRFFAPGGKTMRISGGSLRHYPGSDMKVYVFDTGEVMYKFWRALNAVTVGTRADVASGKASIDCKVIRGRSGLPWDREI